ncbi:MAG: response regulator transcription factor [Akkermansiaceae bacterium]|nr:response regulator transcription factor [Akkermansiaceae bacterium]MCP5544713.1 response regulator transcription factor [Akkermansiaceae bacterium]MCP5545853.1 response regulator transcription factor [Akkermansiaceae bacterium]
MSVEAPAENTSCVHIVDDDESLRTALARLLRAAGHEVRSYASTADFLLARLGPLRGCVLLDVRMPGGPSGLELQRALLRQGETIPVVFLTGHGDIPMSVRAVKDGAFDFLTKPVGKDDLLRVVGMALEEERERWNLAAESREVSRRFESLTPTEKVVFERVIAGEPNKGIAAELGCAERTVKAHRAQVMRKMEAATLPDLVSIATRIPRPN